MDSTFWGCDPHQLDEHAERLLEGARRIQELVDLLQGSSSSTRWDGPDGDHHREATRTATQEMDGLGGDLLGIMRMIREDAEQQELTSSPGGHGLWQVRAGLFGEIRDWEPPEGWNDPVGSPGGPIRLPGGADPQRWRDAWEAAGKYRGTPFAYPFAAGAAPTGTVDGPLPEDSTELNPELVGAVSWVRSAAVTKIPVVGTTIGAVQGAIAMHEQAGSGLDALETRMEDNGFGAFTPAVDAVRIPWAASGAVLGQDGAINQTLEGVDRLVANNIQTHVEIGSALADGDPGGAVAAAEKGVYRGIDAGSDAVMPDSISPWLGAGADTADAAAGVVEPFAPGYAATLQTAGSTLEGWEDGMQAARDDHTGAQNLYDARRRHVPLPYDDRGPS